MSSTLSRYVVKPALRVRHVPIHAPKMSNESKSPKDEVGALIEQIGQMARLQRALPASGHTAGATDSTSVGAGPLDSYLAELERRNHPRTELPAQYRRFPLTIAPIQRIALRIYNLLTKDRRASNFLVRDALKTLQANLLRNETLSRETVVLTDYARALLSSRRTDCVRGDCAAANSQDQTGISSVEMDCFFAALGDEFRGSTEMIKDRLRVYLPVIQAAALTGPALDLGCGRGEWLELLREAAIDSIGVEQNQTLVAACRLKNLHVVEADFVAFVEQSPANHWGIITGFHVMEHLGWPGWYLSLKRILRALGPGGMLILETPNPANLITAANRFYLDPTHRHPLPDALLSFAAKSLGFADVSIMPLHSNIDAAVGAANGIEESPIIQAINGPQDYALIARK